MTQESKVVLGGFALSTLFLAGFQYHLHTQSLAANLLVAQNVNNAAKVATSSAINALGKTEATRSASASATPARKTASASATVRPRVTASPTATPESTPEE